MIHMGQLNASYLIKRNGIFHLHKLVRKVVSLEEAEKRYITRWGHELPDPYGNYDDSNCWFNDSLLEITIRIKADEIIRQFWS